MTKSPERQAATEVLLEYVKDTKAFSEAINDSIESSPLLGEGCEFLRIPDIMEFHLIWKMLPRDGAAKLEAAFDTIPVKPEAM